MLVAPRVGSSTNHSILNKNAHGALAPAQAVQGGIMRLFSKAMFAAVATAAIIAGGPAFAQQKLKWAHVYETSEPYHKWSVWAAEEIKKKTNGKYDIEVFPASTLGKETDINQGLTLGTVDMIISGPSFAARTYPRLGIAYYPFIFRDGDHLIAYSKSPVFAEMVEEFRKKTGIQTTAYTYYGARQTTSNKPFTDCAGMKGLKIRVPDVPAYMATPKSCGANPTPIAFAEVYLALQNGTVDAQENPLTTIEAKKFYEVQKAIMMTSHIVDGLTTQIAPHIWNKLNDAEKKIFTDVTREAAAKATADIKKREAELVDEFKKKGLQIVQVDRKSFIDAVLKNAPLESMGFTRADYDKIVAIK
jgi:tripartite ATP-independent transporter DctP family solute receptor